MFWVTGQSVCNLIGLFEVKSRCSRRYDQTRDPNRSRTMALYLESTSSPFVTAKPVAEVHSTEQARIQSAGCGTTDFQGLLEK
jgi:hypothetical protein